MRCSSFLVPLITCSSLFAQVLVNKQQPPDPAAAAAARAAALDIFAPQIAQAKTLAARKAVAQKIHAIANDGKETAVNRWALYALARETYAAAGEIALAVQTIEEQARLFTIARTDLIAESAEELAKIATAANSKPLLDLIYGGAEEAIEADDFKLAVRLLNIGLTVARKLPTDESTIRRFEIRSKTSVELLRLFNEAKNDQERCRFYCFVKGDWARGLPFLAQSQDEGLAAVAKKDLSKPMDAKDQVDLGDAWFELAENANLQEKSEMLRRAYWWYRMGVENTSGLSKAKVEQRMKLAIDSGAVPEAERALYRTKTVGGKGGDAFEDLPSPHAWLVGFVAYVINDKKFRFIHGIQPIYQNRAGKRFLGKAYGTQKGEEFVVEARSGFVVSGLNLKQGAVRVTGFEVKFDSMPAPNAKKSYISNWIGGGSPIEPAPATTLEMSGKRLIGIYGKCGVDLNKLGLIFSD